MFQNTLTKQTIYAFKYKTDNLYTSFIYSLSFKQKSSKKMTNN